jgi:site-specific DNA-methyltransferase (adenine-specific)
MNKKEVMKGSDFRFLNKVIQSDALEVIRQIPDSIDAVITDPLYGLSKHSRELIQDTLMKWLNGEDGYVPSGKGFMGKSWDTFIPPPLIWKEVFRIMKPGAYLLCFAGARNQDLTTLSLRLSGFEIRDCILWIYAKSFPKNLNIPKVIDKLRGFNEVEYKEPFGSEGRKRRPNGAPFNTKRIGNNGKIPYHKPVSEEAKQWAGWGTALKCVYEPIIVARKPISEQNVALNILKWKTGGLNIKDSRIGDGVEGRYPANLILECICDEVIRSDKSGAVHTNPDCPCFILDKQSGILESGKLLPGHKRGEGTGYSYKCGGGIIQREYGGDRGGASRFFKQVKLEKEDFIPFCYCGKASQKERNIGGVRNRHPCVKPLALMRYLVKLVAPPGGIVLDPFAGSGSTLVACKQLGFSFIGIEKEREYVEIAQARLKATFQIKTIEQRMLFDKNTEKT